MQVHKEYIQTICYQCAQKKKKWFQINKPTLKELWAAFQTDLDLLSCEQSTEKKMFT